MTYSSNFELKMSNTPLLEKLRDMNSKIKKVHIFMTLIYKME